MRVKEESEKAGLKLNIQKIKIMAFNSIPSWQIGGETMETVTDFIFLGSKITTDSDNATKLKDACCLQKKKSFDEPRQCIKNRDITLLTKVCLVKVMVFLVFMNRCESWTIKKAEHWRIHAFELCCWRRLLRDLCKEINQSILKEINREYSMEGLILQLKLQYFCHLMWRADSLEKTLMCGKIEGRRRRGWQRISWLDGITDSTDMSLSKLW